MKQLLTLAAFVVAVYSPAANIDWSISGRGIANGYTTGSALSSTIYFVLADDLTGLANKTTESEFTTALSAITLNSDYSTSDGSKPTVANVVVSSDKITGSSSQTFGIVVYSKDADGNGWYKIATDKNTGYADGASADARTGVAPSWTDLRNASWVSAWTKPIDPDPGPTPGVPEPATGALALAGVALLFKRRRA